MEVIPVNKAFAVKIVLFSLSFSFIIYVGWKAYRRAFHPEIIENRTAAAQPGSIEEMMIQRRDNPEGLQLGYFIGDNGEEVPVTILPEERNTHLYVCGNSDMGKSKGIKYTLLQDITGGKRDRAA
jgi:hypothetical protein